MHMLEIMVSDTKIQLTFLHFFLRHSDEIVIRDIHVKEWKLVYSPLNPIFEELADLAAKSLQLDGVVAANSSEELEAIMFNQELVAGIDFLHSPVKFEVKIVVFVEPK